MAESDPTEASSPHEELLGHLKALLDESLSSEEVLLYDAFGKPILKNSGLWAVADAEWRQAAHQFFDLALERIPLGNLPNSKEELEERLREEIKGLLQAEPRPKWTFDAIDGKLTLPCRLSVGAVEIKGTIPVYTIIAAVVAGLLSRRFPRGRRSPAFFQSKSTRRTASNTCGFRRSFLDGSHFRGCRCSGRRKTAASGEHHPRFLAGQNSGDCRGIQALRPRHGKGHAP